jgi:long-chain acyl-CoA synthetase
MDPRFEREAFIKNVLNHKPNYAVAPTSMYEAFLDEKLLKNKNISYFNYPFEGGEPLKEEVASKIEDVFANHGSPVLLRTAYGQCECGAAITTQTQKNKDGRGSVGMALPGINIKIVDDNFNELSYYQRGQILVDTPCGMIGYYKNEEANKKYFRYDEAGVKWSCTDDIGYLDKDGNLYVQGRASDFSVINGKKIYNFDLENIIMKFNEIKMCDVLPMTDSNGVCNLAVHIVPNMEKFNNQQDIMDFLKVIQEAIYNELGDVDLVPFIFKIRDNFPYAKSGKRDTRKIMKETDGFITIEKYNRSKVLEKL